ncbi:MAG TPA: gamma carbonic anhydrase family protein [Magnetospirillaceae bacterium]|nr:gamma carbonic anhydrase family protein [Magnetospirillaceae bacterium]
MSFQAPTEVSILAYKGQSPRIHPSVLLCPGVRIVGDVQIGEDSSVWFNTVIRGDVNPVRIGKRVNVQDLCMLHVTNRRFSLTLEDGASVGHSVSLHGCVLRSGCLIGVGAVVLDGAVVGRGALVAAGTLVREGVEVPPDSLFAGVPGRVVRELSEEERARVAATAPHYVSYAAEYKSGA